MTTTTKYLKVVPVAVLCMVMQGLSAGQAESKDWPCWRGPTCNGAGVDCGKPLVEDLADCKPLWVSEDPVPGSYEGDARSGGDRIEGRIPGGYGSPIVYGGRVYLYYPVPNGPNWAKSIVERAVPKGGFGREHWYTDNDDVIHCFDAATGKTLWRRVFVEQGYNFESGFNKGGGQFTMCAAYGKVYALGSAARVYAVDAVSGEPVWQSDVGIRTLYSDHLRASWRRTGEIGGGRNDYGGCVMAADGVLVVSDQQEYKGGPRNLNGNGLIAFDAENGRRMWYAVGLGGDGMLSGTPLRWVHEGKEYIIAAGYAGTSCLEPKTGKVLWNIKDAGFNNAGAVDGDRMVIGGPGGVATCYRISLTNAAVLWKAGAGLGVTSPVVYQNHLYADLGDAFCCLDMDSGKVKGRLPGGGLSSSLVGADGRIFRQGTGRGKSGVSMYRMDPESFEPLGKMYDVPYANSVTAAVTDGRLYIRGRDHLHCYDLRIAPAAPVKK